MLFQIFLPKIMIGGLAFSGISRVAVSVDVASLDDIPNLEGRPCDGSEIDIVTLTKGTVPSAGLVKDNLVPAG
jgi:hypothetical protein